MALSMAPIPQWADDNAENTEPETHEKKTK